MCIVCIEMAKGSLTNLEAKRALAEVALDSKQKEHVKEVLDKLRKEEEEKNQLRQKP